MANRTSLATTGNEELDAQNRLAFLRESHSGGTVFIPERWVTADPVLAQAVEELDWLEIATPL